MALCRYTRNGANAPLDAVANAVVYLASDMSSFVTGATIDINGGMYFAQARKA